MRAQRTTAATCLLAVLVLWLATWFPAPANASVGPLQSDSTGTAAAEAVDDDEDSRQVPRVTTTVEVLLDDGTTLSASSDPDDDEAEDETDEAAADAPDEAATDAAADPDAEDAEQSPSDAADDDAADGAATEAPSSGQEQVPADEAPADADEAPADADGAPSNEPAADDGPATDDESTAGEGTAGEGSEEAGEAPADETPAPAATAAAAQAEAAAEEADEPENVVIDQDATIEEITEEASSDDDNTVDDEDVDVDIDMDIGDGDGEADVSVVTGGTATVTTGVADAVGNIADQSVTQIALGTATDNGKVYIDQIVIIANIGVAKANTGGNTAKGNTSEITVEGAGGGGHTVEVDSDGEATITTDVALAIGNESVTEITQEMEVVGDGEDASSIQEDNVENIGSADANSGDNTSHGNVLESHNDHQGGVGSVTDTSHGDASITTGDAEAIGNLSDTTIDQNAKATGSGAARVDAVQIANVINFGAATANTGGNTAVGNQSTSTVAQSGGDVDVEAEGDAAITTGDAYATGNISNTDVSQVAEATASGDAEVYVAQSSVVFNIGAAAANSGFNTALGNVSVTGIGTDGLPNGKTASDLAAMMGVEAGSLASSFWDDWGATITNVVNEVTALLEGTGLYPTAQLNVTEFIIGDPDGAFVRVRQAVLVLDYAVAEATTDDNTATGNANVIEIEVPEETGAGNGGLTIITDGEAEVISGEARADANDSNTVCEQEATGTTPEGSRTEYGCGGGPEEPGEPEDPDGEDPDGEDPGAGDPGDEEGPDDQEPDTGVLPGSEENPGAPSGSGQPGRPEQSGQPRQPGQPGQSGQPGGGTPSGSGGDSGGSTSGDTAVVLASSSQNGSSNGTSTASNGSLASTGAPLVVPLVLAALLIGAGTALVRRRSDSRT